MNHVKTIFRRLLRNKLQTSFIISGLLLAIASSVYILGWISFEQSYDNFHDDDIYRVTIHYKTDNGYDQHWARVNADWVNQLKEDYPEVKNLIRFQSFRPRNVVIGNEAFKENFAYSTDSEVFDVFNFKLLLGDKNALDQPNSVVLTEETAIKYFGNINNAPGQIIQLDSDPLTAPYKVTGVIETPLANTHLPITLLSSINSPQERSGWAYTYIELEKKDQIAQIEQSIRSFINKHKPENPEDANLYFQPIHDIYLHSNLSREITASGQPKVINVFYSVIALLLVIATANFIIFLSTSILSKTKTYTLHKILGAGNTTIRLQIVFESLFLMLIALITAISIVYLTKSQVEILFSTRFLITTKEVSIISSLFLILSLVSISIYVLVFTRFKTQIKTITVKRSGSFGVREALLGLQFALTFGLMMGFYLIHNQLEYMTKADIGIDKDQVIALNDFHTEVSDHLASFKTDIAGISGVKSSTGLMQMPSTAIKDEGNVSLEGKHNQEDGPVMDIQIVDLDFWNTLSIDFVAGENFPQSITLQPGFDYPNETFEDYINNKEQKYVINEKAAELLGYSHPEEALGQKISWYNGFFDLKMGNVVGVVKNYHQEGYNESIDPTVFIYEPILYRNLLIKAESHDMSSIVAQIKDKWESRFDKVPFQYKFLDDSYAQLYEKEVATRKLISAFTVVAICIMALGLVGVVSFELRRRVKELAIRKVLGAYFKDLLTWMAKPYAALMAIGVILTAPVAYFFLQDWLSNYAYRATITGWVFVVPLLIIGFILISTIWVLVRKYSNVNPVNLLRDE
ncbi:MAG: ABC transporter permease [bacterium]|nr:ABC transporter permease [bacterium]